MTTTLTFDAELADHLVRMATMAPSVHNTQPWQFVRQGNTLELRADRRRQLAVLDPDGRQLVQSCGAALHHLRVAARAAGLEPTVALLPAPDDPDLLARVTLRAGTSARPSEVATAVTELQRGTFRGRFQEGPLPAGFLHAVRTAIEFEGARLRLIREEEFVDVQVLVSRAEHYLEADPAYLRELSEWVRPDGIPEEALDLTEDRAELVPGRAFIPTAHPAQDQPPQAEHPVLLLVLTEADTPRDWLQAGQALSQLLLLCAGSGVVAQPIGQVTDIPSTRQALAAALGVTGKPQMLVRVGLGHATRHTLRRPVSEVLEVR